MYIIIYPLDGQGEISLSPVKCTGKVEKDKNISELYLYRSIKKTKNTNKMKLLIDT